MTSLAPPTPSSATTMLEQVGETTALIAIELAWSSAGRW
jgi:hypothetical protein